MFYNFKNFSAGSAKIECDFKCSTFFVDHLILLRFSEQDSSPHHFAVPKGLGLEQLIDTVQSARAGGMGKGMILRPVIGKQYISTAKISSVRMIQMN